MDFAEAGRAQIGCQDSNAPRLLAWPLGLVGEIQRMTNDDSSERDEWNSTIDRLRSKYDADIAFYSGDISVDGSRIVIEAVEGRASGRPNLILILVTLGGDPDEAFRIMRCLQGRYKSIRVVVPDYCKSAGTLIAIGADCIAMADNSQLGPIDMQVGKHDEVFDRSSSLTPQQSLDVLSQTTFHVFEKNFFTLRRDTLRQLTSKTCADIAARLVIGMFEPIFAQIDPMRIAEMNRAMSVASQYGSRLNRGNLKKNGLANLISGYPSHEFVIDRDEARKLFTDVQDTSKDELTISREVKAATDERTDKTTPAFLFIEPIPAGGPGEETPADAPEHDERTDPQPGGDSQESGPTSRTAPAKNGAAADRPKADLGKSIETKGVVAEAISASTRR